MANKKISQLTPSGDSLQDVDLIEGELAAGGNSKKYTGAQVRAVEKAEREEADDAIIAGVGLDTDGSYVAPTGTTHLDATTSVMDALETLDGVTGGATSAGALNILNTSDGSGGFVATGIKVDDEKILSDSPTLKTASDTTFTPTVDDHLVTKKYVDDNANPISQVTLSGDITGTANAASSWDADTTIANNAVTTTKILDNNVTLPKIAQIASEHILANPTKNTDDVVAVDTSDDFNFSDNTMSLNSRFNFTKYSQYATITNTTSSAVDLLGTTAFGSRNFDADSLYVGRTIRTTLRGWITNDNPTSGQLEVSVLFYPALSGEVGIVSNNEVRVDVNADSEYFEISFDINIRTTGSTGTAVVIGNILANATATDGVLSHKLLPTTNTFTINTTVENTVRVRAAWASGATNCELKIETATIQML